MKVERRRVTVMYRRVFILRIVSDGFVQVAVDSGGAGCAAGLTRLLKKGWQIRLEEVSQNYRVLLAT
jgi:hypothetical protein